MTTTINSIFYEATDLLETLSCHDKVYACVGIDDDGNKYTAIANVSWGEIVSVEEIEKV